jgi:hypothetical protein
MSQPIRLTMQRTPGALLNSPERIKLAVASAQSSPSNAEVCGPAPLSPTAEKPTVAGSVSTALLGADVLPERRP